mmetsp:Transcript_8581/g.22190  ORF Transcript_8581/g.22190 Transcript_8581/m.22190 type:complete len:247 (+) Transcript_8581:67-807(+)
MFLYNYARSASGYERNSPMESVGPVQPHAPHCSVSARSATSSTVDAGDGYRPVLLEVGYRPLLLEVGGHPVVVALLRVVRAVGLVHTPGLGRRVQPVDAAALARLHTRRRLPRHRLRGVLSGSRCGRAKATPTARAREHLGDARRVAHDEEVGVEVRDEERAARPSRGGDVERAAAELERGVHLPQSRVAQHLDLAAQRERAARPAERAQLHRRARREETRRRSGCVRADGDGERVDGERARGGRG